MNLQSAGPAGLFCPADRPDRYSKAAERSDGVILDLEDAVASKVSARQALVAHPLDPDHTVVRVSSVTSGELRSAVRAAQWGTEGCAERTPWARGCARSA